MENLKFCKDCAHYEERVGPIYPDAGNAPQNKSVDIVTGNTIHLHRPRQLRSDISQCRRDGAWFQPKAG